MDDELQELEAELRRLRPCAPAPELNRRIATRLKAGRPAMLIRWALWPMAAALVGGLGYWVRPTKVVPVPQPLQVPAIPAPPTSASAGIRDVYQPVAAENVLYATKDEGLVTLGNGVPVRRVHNSYIDTITWRNPQTNASLRWSVPREEVRVVPVNFQ